MANWARAAAICRGDFSDDDMQKSLCDSVADSTSESPRCRALLETSNRELELSNLLSAKVAAAAHRRAEVSALVHTQSLAKARLDAVNSGPETAARVHAATAAAKELDSHFAHALSKRHVLVDRLRPRAASEALRLRTDLHAPVAEFVNAALEADAAARADGGQCMWENPVQAADWLAKFAPDQTVVDAGVQDATAIFALMQSTFDRSREAHDVMARLHEMELAHEPT